MWTKAKSRTELKAVVDKFFTRQWSPTVRVELSDTIVAAYTGAIIDREEYQSLMGSIR